MPVDRRDIAQMLAEALLVDREVVGERQQDGRNDAMGHIMGVTGHFGRSLTVLVQSGAKTYIMPA